MPQTNPLSPEAEELLRRRCRGEPARVTPANRDLYRELTRAGIMYPVSGFVGGPESSFRFTEEGWGRRHEWLSGPGSAAPLPR